MKLHNWIAHRIPKPSYMQGAEVWQSGDVCCSSLEHHTEGWLRQGAMGGSPACRTATEGVVAKICGQPAGICRQAGVDPRGSRHAVERSHAVHSWSIQARQHQSLRRAACSMHTGSPLDSAVKGQCVGNVAVVEPVARSTDQDCPVVGVLGSCRARQKYAERSSSPSGCPLDHHSLAVAGQGSLPTFIFGFHSSMPGQRLAFYLVAARK